MTRIRSAYEVAMDRASSAVMPAPQESSAAPVRTTCEDCARCFLKYYGYSNYTVEGRYAYCMVDGPLGTDGVDCWYGEEPRLQVAATCPFFTPGEPSRLDVDCEDEDELSPQALEWWLAFNE